MDRSPVPGLDRILGWLNRYLAMAGTAVAVLLAISLWLTVERGAVQSHVSVMRYDATRLHGADILPYEATAAMRDTKGSPTVAWFLVTIPPSPEAATDRHLVLETGVNQVDAIWSLPVPGAREPARQIELKDSPIGHLALLTRQGPDTGARWLVRYRSPGIGKPKINVIPADRLGDAIAERTLHAAIYTTIFLVLATFSAVIALSASEWSFLVMSAWLLMALRVLAVNEGWGVQWLSDMIGPDGRALLLPTTLAAHGMFAIALFIALMGRERVPTVQMKVFQWAQISLCVLAPSAVLLSPTWSYLLIWAVSLASLGMGAPTSAWIAWKHRDPIAAVVALGWVFALLGMSSELAYGLDLIRTPPSFLNARIGSLAGALLCALALALRIREESKGRSAASDAYREARNELARSYDEMPIGLFTCNESGQIIRFNPAFAEIHRKLRGASPVLNDTSLSDIAEADAVRAVMARDLTSDSVVVTAEAVRGLEPVTLSIRARPRGPFTECSVEDISRRIAAEQALARLNDHDPLTEALNLHGLHAALEMALTRVRLGVSCGVIAVDIDRFKVLNELYGYTTADTVLVTVAARLRPVLGPGDLLARVSDSFHIVSVDRRTDSLAALAQHLLNAVSARSIELEGRVHSVTASVGVIELDGAMETRDAIAAVTQACDSAKLRGRNRIAQPSTSDSTVNGYLEDLKVQAHLRDHLQRQRFHLVMQPIISLLDPRDRLRYEVLIRMRGEDGQIIPPSRFIPAAERNGQMPHIDRWVLLQTLTFLQEHPAHSQRLDYATINLSGASLNDPRFVEDAIAMINDFPTLWPKVCVEITETVALADRQATRRFADRIHQLGGRIALDDFGAGFTSFAYMRELGADIVKIDGSFISDIDTNVANHSITRMLANLSHELGMHCVAEWVETPAIVEALMEIGIDFGQGFGLARPLDPIDLLRAGSSMDLVADPRVRQLLEHGPTGASPVLAPSGTSGGTSRIERRSIAAPEPFAIAPVLPDMPQDGMR